MTLGAAGAVKAAGASRLGAGAPHRRHRGGRINVRTPLRFSAGPRAAWTDGGLGQHPSGTGNGSTLTSSPTIARIARIARLVPRPLPRLVLPSLPRPGAVVVAAAGLPALPRLALPALPRLARVSGWRTPEPGISVSSGAGQEDGGGRGRQHGTARVGHISGARTPPTSTSHRLKQLHNVR